MSHSYRRHVHWGLVILEIAIFIGAVAIAYYSEKQDWQAFALVALGLAALYTTVKVFEALPRARELLAFEDMAGKLAAAAIPYGVRRYYNMQDPKEQDERNRETQAAIADASGMWLCANSGASYLDPAIYRHWTAIQKRLSTGIDFRVVLLDPLSREKAFRNQLNVDGEQFDSKINIPNLVKLYNAYPTLEVRFVSEGMHATVFATGNLLFFDPYHVGVVNDRIENRSFCLKIESASPREGVDLYRLFKSHFDSLWQASISFEDWMEEARDVPSLQGLALKARHRPRELQRIP